MAGLTDFEKGDEEEIKEAARIAENLNFARKLLEGDDDAWGKFYKEYREKSLLYIGLPPLLKCYLVFHTWEFLLLSFTRRLRGSSCPLILDRLYGWDIII